MNLSSYALKVVSKCGSRIIIKTCNRYYSGSIESDLIAQNYKDEYSIKTCNRYYSVYV